MVTTKVIVLLIALSAVVALIAGIAFSQFANAQSSPTRNVIGQTPQGTINGAYPYPQQGYYPYGSGQYGDAHGYGYGGGMSMCGRFWQTNYQ